MAAAPSRMEMMEERSRFFRLVACAIGILVVVHLFAQFLSQPGQPRDSFRLLMTVAFFGSGLWLCYLMLEPRSNYHKMLLAFRYEDAPPNLDRSWRRYSYSLDRVVRIVVYLAMGLLASTGWTVLALWFHGLYSVIGIVNLCWWLSMIGLILFPFAGQPMIAEVLERRRALDEETRLTQWYQPRSLDDLYSNNEANQSTVETIGNQKFRAGGVEWHWDEFTQNCVVFGQSGSGKTVCVLNPLLESLLSLPGRSGALPGGLILDPKGDFRGKLRKLCKQHGRENDLLVIDPRDLNQTIRWNPLDSDDDELEVASRFAAVMNGQMGQDSENMFWVDSAKKFVRHAISLIRLTNAQHVPPSFRQINELAASISAVAERTDRLDVTNDECENCLSFFANEWLDLAEQTRSSIRAFITNMVDPFLMAPYSTVFSGRSTMRISEVVKQGKILYVDMPIADKEEMARTIGTLIKLEYFREVLMSPDKPRPTFFLCDEFQAFFTVMQGKGDSDFFERSRQSNHVNIIATQNLPALLKQAPKKDPVTNLLGNCAVKIFLRNTDKETNDYGSELFGEQLVGQSGSSAGGAAGLGRMRLEGAGRSSSTSDQYDKVMRPERFTELAIPSRAEERDYCETILHHAGRSDLSSTRRKLRWKVHPIV